MISKNISQTGYRILKILNILINEDVSRSEIIELLKNDEIINKTLSDDTVTFYINTLRKNGFNISRPHKHNGYKYTIKENIPFLPFKKSDIEHLEKIKKFASENGDWIFILNFNCLMHSLSKFIPAGEREYFKQQLLNSKPFMYTENAKILDLYKIAQNSETAEIVYKSPNGGDRIFKVKTLNISLENNKLYFWCENLVSLNIQYLRIDRIKSFKVIDAGIKAKTIYPKVLYKLKGQEAILYNPVYDNEKIISKDETEVIVETSLQNEFWLVQKILSYGRDCTILQPDSVRKKIAEKIQKIKGLYE
jgi:predicted DNA-binding transcriptional regulator YafY